MFRRILAALLLGSVCAGNSIPENLNKLVRLGELPSASDGEIRVKRADLEWENSVCECTAYYQCNVNGSMNENGLGIIDIRVGFVGTVDNPTSKRRKCKDYLDVCCLPPEILSDRDNQPNTEGENQKPPGGQEGGQGGIIGQSHVNKGCGYRNVNGIGFRITGNFENEANFAEFPWMVAVLKESTVNRNPVKVYQCGGSLIHSRVVLTAAHCVHGASATEITIRAGEWDTQSVSEPLAHQDRAVSVISTHPQYTKDVLYNDYALLILAEPVKLADNVEVVCLPNTNDVFDYSKCFATGWGKNNFGEKGRYQVILKAIELPIVPRDKCQSSLRTTRLGKYFKLHNSFMCAGGVEGLDTCTGDGGSPLVCPLFEKGNRYVQAGIVAWGIGCGGKVPGVYADVSKAREWIDEVFRSYNIDSLSYTAGLIA